MFRTVCQECARKFEERAAQSKRDRDILIYGCPHNKVGVTLLVNGGLIVGWNLWPVTDEESFRDRATIQFALMHEFMNLGGDAGQSDKIVKY